MGCSRSVSRHMTAGGNTLVFTSNSAGLIDVMNNACAGLDFKLLAIERNITPDHEALCLYDPGKADFSFCSINEAEHAHLYISTNILNQHCIILFADRTLSKKSDINGLVDKFHNSIERLKRQNPAILNNDLFKPLRFYIYFFGNDPPLALNDSINYIEKFSRTLEKRLGYGINQLDACVSPSMIGCHNRLTIKQKSNLLDLVLS